MSTKEDKILQGQTIIDNAICKRQLAQALWDEAEQEMAEGKRILAEAEEERA